MAQGGGEGGIVSIRCRRHKYRKNTKRGWKRSLICLVGARQVQTSKPLADVFLYATKDIRILIEFAVTLCSVAEEKLKGKDITRDSPFMFWIIAYD